MDHIILCPTWIYKLWGTFNNMWYFAYVQHINFMFNMNLRNKNMSNMNDELWGTFIYFYVRYESTNHLGHSIICGILLMSNISFYVQHESTNSEGHSITCGILLMSNMNLQNISMSNMSLQNIMDIKKNSMLFKPHVPHTIVIKVSLA